MTSESLALSIAPDTEEVPVLLDAIEAFCEREELSPGTAHRLAVVVEELAANVAMHGATGEGAASFVAVTITREGATLTAIVEDDGRPFDPLARDAVDTEAALEDREIGGLGVHFARTMAREIAYARMGGRNRVTALFDAA